VTYQEPPQPPYQGEQGGSPPQYPGSPPGPGSGYQGSPGGYQAAPGGAPPGYQGAPGGAPQAWQEAPGAAMPYGAGPGGPAAGPGAYADWARRAGAFIIDYIPYVVLIMLGVFTLRYFIGILFYLAALAYWIYNRFYLGGQGQTYGKRVMGIRLISEETGQPIGALMAFVRDIAHTVDGIICGIGYLFPLWDAKRQTIADKIMKTIVVPT
jgi:uncharacterized RDD family membrane protein YckC